MKQEIDPKDTSRAKSFELWMDSPMPMVTVTKEFDVTHLLRKSRRTGLKFNMLMCYCIVGAAKKVPEFFVMPEGGKLYQFDKLSVNVIVNNKEGGINSCDILENENLDQFNADYLRSTKQVAESCRSIFHNDTMVVGTSALVRTKLDSIVNQYSLKFSNPFLSWGCYRKGLFRTTLPVSFQFHHVQMDGMQAAKFLDNFQNMVDAI